MLPHTAMVVNSLPRLVPALSLHALYETAYQNMWLHLTQRVLPSHLANDERKVQRSGGF